MIITENFPNKKERDPGISRVGWVDIAKGITMLIVIWMHVRNNMPSCEMYAQLNRCFSILYMPCFFIISGFFIKEE